MRESDHSHTDGVVHIKNGDDAENADVAFNEFKKRHGIHFILAFSGGADDESPILQAFKKTISDESTGIEPDILARMKGLLDKVKETLVSDIVEAVLSPLPREHIAILTGGTAWGVPAVAAKVAKDLGFKTIGVYPQTAAKKPEHMLPDGTLDIAFCVHPFIGESRWGEEAAIFTKLLNAVVVIGGGAGTMVEVAHLLKRNEKAELTPKFIIPVHHTGGTADLIRTFPGKPAVMVRCIPQETFTTGKEVANFLIQTVLTEDIYPG